MNNNMTKLASIPCEGEGEPKQQSQLMEFIWAINQELNNYNDSLNLLETNISKFKSFYVLPCTSEEPMPDKPYTINNELEKIINYFHSNNTRLDEYRKNIETII